MLKHIHTAIHQEKETLALRLGLVLAVESGCPSFTALQLINTAAFRSTTSPLVLNGASRNIAGSMSGARQTVLDRSSATQDGWRTERQQMRRSR